jgi:hypothetical protein
MGGLIFYTNIVSFLVLAGAFGGGKEVLMLMAKFIFS